MTAHAQLKPAIIGIRGFFQSGKDTVAEILEELFDIDDRYDVDIYSFANNLREAIALIFGFDIKYVFSESFKTDKHNVHVIGLPGTRMSGRELLQYFGTQICRNMDMDCWSRSCINRIDPGDEIVIIKDVRFFSEVQAIRGGGNPSFIIHVERPGHVGDSHQSEQELADAEGIDDFVIQNDGSLDDLTEKVRQVYLTIEERIRREADKSIGKPH